MVQTVILTMKFQPGKRDEGVKALDDPEDGLVKTRKFQGCQSVECYLNPDGVSLHLYEKWDKAEDQQAYLAMRGAEAKAGKLLAKLGPIFAEPPSIVSFGDNDKSKI